jgi:hypothetical protein
LPLVLGFATVAARAGIGEPPFSLWFSLWIPTASVTGVWMGLREEGGGPGAGERLWMLAPLLLLSAALTLAPDHGPALDRAWTRLQRTALAELRAGGVPEPRVREMEGRMKEQDPEVRRTLPYLVPSGMFLWMALLVAVGRGMAARLAERLGWPPLSRDPFLRLRLPDAALAALLAGLALALLAGSGFRGAAVALLVPVVLGYGLQGLAVLSSLMLSRGVPPAFAALLMFGMFALTTLAFLPSLALVGLADAWLDLRKLDPPGGREA